MWATNSCICVLWPHTSGISSLHTRLLEHAFLSLDSSSNICRSHLCCYWPYFDALKQRKFWCEQPTFAFVFHNQIRLEFPHFHTHLLKHAFLSLDSSSNICKSRFCRHHLYSMDLSRENSSVSNRLLHLCSTAKYALTFLTSIRSIVVDYWNMLFWALVNVPHQTFVGHVFVVTDPILMHLNRENSGVINQLLHLCSMTKYVQNFLTSITCLLEHAFLSLKSSSTIFRSIFLSSPPLFDGFRQRKFWWEQLTLVFMFYNPLQICPEFPHFHTCLLKYAFLSLDSSSSICRSRFCCYWPYFDALNSKVSNRLLHLCSTAK